MVIHLTEAEARFGVCGAFRGLLAGPLGHLILLHFQAAPVYRWLLILNDFAGPQRAGKRAENEAASSGKSVQEIHHVCLQLSVQVVAPRANRKQKRGAAAATAGDSSASSSSRTFLIKLHFRLGNFL